MTSIGEQRTILVIGGHGGTEMNRRSFLVASLSGCFYTPRRQWAHAEDYPNHPIKLIVPGSAGGVLDVVARRITDPAGRQLGQPIVVENRPGASGSIGAEVAAKAKPDGYTLFLGSSTTISMNPLLMPDLAYNPERDFAPITMGSKGYPILVIGMTLQVTTLEEFVKLAKANPSKLSCGSPGVGTPNYFGVKLLERLSGIQLNHVMYKNQPEIVTDLIGGQIQVALDFAPLVGPHIKAKRIKALVVAGPVRKPALPDIPTAKEAGAPEFEVTGWHGYFARSGTTTDICNKLNRALAAAIRAPEFSDYARSLGSEPGGNSAENFTAFVRSDKTRWARLVTEAGIKLG